MQPPIPPRSPSGVAPATFRIRRLIRGGERPDKYRESYEVSDESTGMVLASCDLTGRVVETTLTIADDCGRSWELSPNRRVMPTRWTLVDHSATVQMQFDLRLAGKLINPIQRTSLALLDPSGAELARLMDGRKGVADRVLGVVINNWIVVQGDQLVAQMRSLPSREPPRPGLRARLARFLTSADRGLVVYGTVPGLTAPALLALIALHDEVTSPA